MKHDVGSEVLAAYLPPSLTHSHAGQRNQLLPTPHNHNSTPRNVIPSIYPTLLLSPPFSFITIMYPRPHHPNIP